jgi:hypothetical protein
MIEVATVGIWLLAGDPKIAEDWTGVRVEVAMLERPVTAGRMPPSSVEASLTTDEGTRGLGKMPRDVGKTILESPIGRPAMPELSGSA